MATTCKNCGAPLVEDANFCTECGQPVVDEPKVETNPDTSSETPRKEETVHEAQPSPSTPTENPQPVTKAPSSSGGKKLVGIIIILLVLAGTVGGYFYYQNIYIPEKIDREAPRYYTLADAVVLRSSPSAGADFNKIGSLPYGTELITYEHDKDWSRVKVNTPSASGEKLQGYVASPFILNKTDFFLLNSIFGDTDSQETVYTSKCRLALLNYFKEKQYIGKMADAMRTEAGILITPNEHNQWQVFSRPANRKPNTVFFKRLTNPYSKFTDFAVIIQNTENGERKLLYFRFDDDETPHFVTEQAAPPTGFIKDIYIYSQQGNNYLHVDYSE